MPTVAISMEKDTLKFLQTYISDIAESNFMMTSHSKLFINFLHSMLSRIMGVMFKVKQLYLPKMCTSFACYALFGYFNSLVMKVKDLKKLSK